MFPTPEFAIYETVLAYAKIYPSMTKLYVFDQPSRVRVAGYEARKTTFKHRTANYDPIYFLDSLRRAKTRLTDLVLSNRFDLFCTFTFAEDRQNVDLLKKRMSKWLDHQNQRVGKFAYLVVPEFHKDGKSIHFHALFKGYKGELIDSGHRRKDGRPVYNIPGYTLGFSTATKIDDEGVPLVASYIKKYITKDMPQFNNRKRYWCSHGLVRPEKVRNPVIFPSEMQKFTEEHQMRNMTLRIAHERMGLFSSAHRGKLLE